MDIEVRQIGLPAFVASGRFGPWSFTS